MLIRLVGTSEVTLLRYVQFYIERKLIKYFVRHTLFRGSFSLIPISSHQVLLLLKNRTSFCSIPLVWNPWITCCTPARHPMCNCYFGMTLSPTSSSTYITSSIFICALQTRTTTKVRRHILCKNTISLNIYYDKSRRFAVFQYLLTVLENVM
ncbi:unnamed protein product [Ixodes pacificus]